MRQMQKPALHYVTQCWGYMDVFGHSNIKFVLSCLVIHPLRTKLINWEQIAYDFNYIVL